MRCKKYQAVFYALLTAAGLFTGPRFTYAAVAAELPEQVSGMGATSAVPSEYQTQVVKSLADLPASIRDTITSHLRDRLGDAYFARLTFDMGQIATLKPGKTAGGVRMFAYRAVFSISDPEKGIGRYTSDIWLDAEGRIVRDIELPAVKTSPRKAAFAPLSCAFKAAAALGITPTSSNLAYDTKTDSIVYVLRQETEDKDTSGAPGSKGCIVNRHTATISAHTCEVLHSEAGYMRPYICPNSNK